MCDVCGEFLDLLLLYEEKATKECEEQPPLKKEELETVFMYMQSWSQRQCMCCFRDPKNFERFSLLTQSVIILGVHHLKELRDRYLHSSPSKRHKKGFNNDTSLADSLSVMPDIHAGGDSKNAHVNASIIATDSAEAEKVGQCIASEDNKTTEISDICSVSKDKIKEIDDKPKNLDESDKPKTDDEEMEDEEWTLQDLEKLLHLLSKVFLVNFPLYAAYKHSIQAKLEDLSQHEVSYLSSFCDLHDPEIPIYLLRNVCFFCKSGGLQAMTACFEQSPETLSVTLAHAIIAIVGNLKLWLNFQATMQLFVPLRSKVLRYMCSLADKDLRMPSIKSMADYMWSAVKDPLDSPVTFDKDGMDLAFKYFTSSTLTMRLAGISQINSHINLFNELVNNESIIEVENVGQHLASWLIDNQIISHIFGPNLHVEVIKQSHVILSFLAMECKVTNEHIDIIWQAAQLKHCSKQVHDLLPPLIKNLDGGPVLHLYNLLCKLEPKEHTEQSLYLASALIKFIWTSGGTYGQMPGVAPFVGLPKSALLGLNSRTRVAELSSSENSVSMEGSNSEEEPPDSSSSHKVPSESSDGPSPLKQARKHKRHAEESSDDSVKVEDLEDEEDEEEEEELLKETDGNKNTLGLKSVKKQTVNIKALSRKLMERCQPTKIELNSDNESDVEDSVDKIRKRRRSKLFKKSRPKLQECLESCASLCEVQQLREAHLDECSDEEDCETASEDEHLPPKVMLKTVKPDQQVPKKPTNFVQPIRGSSRESSPDSARGGVMSELANLVQRSPHEIHDCRPFLRSFQAHGELIDEMSGEDGSYSSRMSTKSEKNMADFDGEDSGCEDELAHLAAQAQAHLSPHSIPQHLGFQARFPPNKLPIRMLLPETTRIRSQFKIENVCKPGNTLLWDLLQDDKIIQLGDGVAIEAEKDLCNLLCYNTERSIRMKFIEGCLENLANNWSVVISLRLLPKLFASFQQFRGMDTHQITTWAEKELHMMTHFFNNLQVYTKDGSHSNLHSHQMEIQVRLQFLTSVFTPLGSQEAFRLSLDQVDILWSCLATDPRCCDELFSWLLAQAKNKDATVNVLCFSLSLDQVDILWSCLATDPRCCDELFSWLLSQAKNKDATVNVLCFSLSLDQVDILWSCLATDPRCCDELFSWLLSQAKNKDATVNVLCFSLSLDQVDILWSCLATDPRCCDKLFSWLLSQAKNKDATVNVLCFSLSLDQVDILWSCLATDPRCCDELFSWLLSQAKNKDATVNVLCFSLSLDQVDILWSCLATDPRCCDKLFSWLLSQAKNKDATVNVLCFSLSLDQVDILWSCLATDPRCCDELFSWLLSQAKNKDATVNVLCFSLSLDQVDILWSCLATDPRCCDELFSWLLSQAKNKDATVNVLCFSLSLDQVDILWSCLATDPRCCDELFSWLLSQAKNKDATVNVLCFSLSLDQVDILWSCLATDPRCCDKLFSWLLSQAKNKDATVNVLCFSLSLDQVDILWSCLATDPRCCDELFSWLLSQAKNKDATVNVLCFSLSLDQVDILWSCLATDPRCCDKLFSWLLSQAKNKDATVNVLCFSLSLDQVDILWSCLATDPRCCDELFSWLLSQAKNKDATVNVLCFSLSLDQVDILWSCLATDPRCCDELFSWLLSQAKNKDATVNVLCFSLSLDQVDILWSCLATDPRCCDELFSWLLSQAKNKDATVNVLCFSLSLDQVDILWSCLATDPRCCDELFSWLLSQAKNKDATVNVLCFSLSLDQVDILWSCLATDPRCCDELFSWLLSQAKNKDATVNVLCFSLSLDQVDILWSCLATDPRCCDELFSWLLSQAKNKDATVNVLCFSLSLDQVDILWSCLATDPRCCDELFSWLLAQAKNKDAHALGMETLKHLYLRKLPTLEPEIMSMTGLALFQQLCNLARLATVHLDSQKEMDVVGMDHLWRIALKASNTEVSMAAIQYLNSYYIGRQLDHESEFVSQCMAHLALATADLATAEESSLLCIQRALLLLKTHLETFRRRYAYHLRRWALEGRGVGSHVQLIGERGCVPLRLVVQPAGLADKGTLELLTSDYVADLRAEVAKWWEALQAGAKLEATPVLGSLLAEGPLRMITQGQELTTEFDEKSLEEMGFKDLQIIFISMGVSRQQKKRDSLDVPSVLPPPPRESLPTLLLLQPKYFEQLFALMHTLSSMKTSAKGHQMPHTKAQVLSRRVWDILTLLPTSPTLLQGFQQLDQSVSQLLDPASSQKFMYSLYIVESLGRQSTARRTKKPDQDSSPDETKVDPSWNLCFVQCGGLRHLFDIFMSGVLQRSGGGDGSEWQQDCLALLLKLLCQLGVASEEMDSADGGLQVNKTRKLRKASSDRQTVPKLNEAMLQMMNVDSVMPRLTSILHESSLPRDPNHYKTGFWGRAQVVHYSMALLVSWVHSSEQVRQVLFSVPHFSSWLQRLVLEDPEPAVRREVCTALYRLCLDGTSEESGCDNFNITAHLLMQLLEYLDIAEGMRPQKPEMLQHPTEDGKEPYGPACRDYFWLLCRLVNSLQDDFIKESIEDPGESIVDFNTLAIKLSESILAREYLETRHNTVEDDGLIGVLNLMSNVMKHNPPFKTSKRGQEFLLRLFDFLFALPNPRKRHVPKCKSQMSRSSAYDLLVELVKGAPENYQQIHDKLLAQQKPGPHSPYPWDYWPHDDGRSDCGYVGLTNLGATCYMASCMQHLYMMPQARAAILRAKCDADSKHELTLQELQRMFAYLLESERKAYNPRSFCKVYTMDHQPLNTGEQKDMAEFFIDLVSKLEEMTPELKKLVKTLFGGVISNNVVSLDCEHVSRTLEEFYTVRCQVADMRNLYDSLDEVTVKDTLEGDNMYTCSQCGKKVRAEKRACFKKLPHILCFNTMRYTFNMVTMLKEKVNTHFSFPLRLDMSGYVEKHLMPQRYQEEKRKSQLRKSEHSNEEKEEGEISGDSKLDENGPYECSDSEDFNECYEYDLIGVTVHTGTADGGHYYSFIRDRTTSNRDKWFLFNDAEVKPFDPNQIASECFGGEMTSKTYDSVTDKFMDFSFEKTNSAYMLFYEWCSRDGEQRGSKDETSELDTPKSVVSYPTIELSKELEDWIWQDNMQFLNDKNIFEHTYFTFMWQICGCIPQTLLGYQPDITAMAARLSTSFFIETFIHAKEKPTMVQWVELLTKQFNASQAACEWFLDHMAHDDWWPMQILIKCPNQIVRQMFQRLCIHVIQRLRQNHAMLYLKSDSDDEVEEIDPDRIGRHSCITRFVKMLLSLMEHGAKAHLKHLTEYFSFLNEFSRMGEEETHFLISVQAISSMVNFYLGQKSQDMMEIVSEEEEEEEVIPIPTDKYKPASLEKMITLIASLLEKSRGEDHVLQISPLDMNAIAGAKGFPFLYLQIKDSINMNQTRNLIFALCRWNERVALHIIAMIFQAINKHADMCQPFFKILTLLTEPPSGPSGLPCFSQLILQRIWEVAEFCPQPALDWLAGQVPRNKMAHTWVLQTMDTWVEHFLIGHNIQRVRAAAGYLLVSLVPSSHFKQSYRTTRNLNVPHKDLMMPADAQLYLHQIYTTLLRLLKPARHYTDIQTHGTTKLTAYFALMTYCCISRTEKLMFGPYFLDLWQLFHPRLSEPTAPVHHNKQSLLLFWHHVLIDCPENVQLILQNPHCVKNIPYNYILADHEDQDVVLFNRTMLPAYYGILRMVCQQSRPFAKTLSTHQNMTWAYKNITPHPTQYPGAVDEIFKMIQLFITRFPDSSEEELLEVANFRRHLLQTYLQVLDGKACWATLVMALRSLVENDDDRLFVIYNGGLHMAFEAFHTLHLMYHEATACHVSGDMLELLSIILDMVKCLRVFRDAKDAHGMLIGSKEWPEMLRKIATMLNTYNPPDIRKICIDVLRETLLLIPIEVIQTLVPLLWHCHSAFQEAHNSIPMGPYFPRRGHKLPPLGFKQTTRPVRPMVQMTVPHNQLEASKGVDDEYDQALIDFYSPYHDLVDMMCRLAINHDCMSETLVNLSAMVGFEGVPLHFVYFPKLWLDIYHAQHVDKKFISILCSCNSLADYIESVLLDEKTSLNIPIVYNFLCLYFPKVSTNALTEATCNQLESMVATLADMISMVNRKSSAWKLNGDLRTLCVIYSAEGNAPPSKELLATLNQFLCKVKSIQKASEELDSILGGETPVKRRKLSSEEKEEESKSVVASPSCSKETEKDLPVVNEDPVERIPQQTPPKASCNWLEALEKTIIDLKTIIESKG